MPHSHKFHPGLAHVLEDPGRREFLDPERVLDLARVERGEVFLDVGCGTGYFARPAAMRVGSEGRVVCADIEPRLLDVAQEKAAAEGLTNVTFVRSSESNIPWGEESVDVALLANVLHELDGEGTLQEIRRLLRPEGRLLVVDWKREVTPMGPPLEMRPTLTEAEARVGGAGFVLTHAAEPGPYHFAMMFRRR